MKISKEAIEAGARAMDAVVFDDIKGISYTGRMLMSEKCIEAALPHLQDCKESPQTVQSPAATATQVAIDDEEVERVGKAIYDEVALQPIVAIGPYVADPTHEASRSARWAARAAIRAIREGGKRWGVWNVTSKSWVVNTQIDEPRHWSGSEDDAQFVCVLMSTSHPRLAFQVLPYPGKRAKTPEEIADECLSPVKFFATLAIRNEVQAKIAAAIRDAKGGK